MNDQDPSPATTVRRLLRARDRGTLSTLTAPGGETPEGMPYGSLVLLAGDRDGAPLLLISTLAEHTRNLTHDPRASLLIEDTAGLDDPLTGPRATLVGEIGRDDSQAARDRFLARHPSARMYADFGDFSFYRMTVAHCHLVAGFGRIAWVPAARILPMPAPEALGGAEAEVVEHMNEDHSDAVQLFARVALGLDETPPNGTWTMTGLDAEGFDLRQGGQVARLAFDHPIEDAEGARGAMVRMLKRARADLAGDG